MRSVWSRGGCFGAGYRLYFGVRFFMLKKFVLGSMLVVAALLGNACGGDDSSDSSPMLAAEESSSSVDETLSSSTTEAPSSSAKDKESSSSVKSKASSSSEKSAKSSSSKDTEPGDKSSSSMKNGGSSSSAKTKESSSSEKKEVSSSSEKPVESSGSEKVEESSSSEKSSSSSAKSSSSEESSSSETKPSSSEKSSSSEEQNSSSSLESTGICKTKTEDNCIYGTVYDDRDGKTYKTVKIGEQEWMAENLRYVDSTQSVCYANNPDNCQIYGRLYDRNGALNNCPEGWRLPSEKDWLDLRDFAKKNSTNKYIGQLFRADTLWNVSELGVGYDAFGFGALPAGGYDEDGWWGVKTNSIFWLSDSYKIGTLDCFVYTRIRYKLKDNSDIQIGKEVCVQNPNSYFSVRCLKDSE